MKKIKRQKRAVAKKKSAAKKKHVGEQVKAKIRRTDRAKGKKTRHVAYVPPISSDTIPPAGDTVAVGEAAPEIPVEDTVVVREAASEVVEGTVVPDVSPEPEA